MTDELACLEMTAWVGGRSGYADSPKFDREVWPVLDGADQLIDVYVLSGQCSVGHAVLRRSVQVRPGVHHVGRLSALTSREKDRIAGASFYGGHLGVLFVTHDLLLLRRVAALFPRCERAAVSGFGFESPAEEREFFAAISELADGPGVLTFAHDADPAFVFGTASLVANVLATHTERPGGTT